jgi:outer membrane usher protein
LISTVSERARQPILRAIGCCAFLFSASALAESDAPKLFGKQIAPTVASLNALLPASGGDFNTTAIATIDPRAKDHFLRLESTWSRELDESAQSLRLGDGISNPGSWGSAVRFAGVQFGTEFDLRSDLISNDRIALSGVSVLPSTADAILAQAADTPMTQQGISVNGKATVSGVNSLTFNARDANGKITAITRPLFARTLSAEIGCKRYALGFGRARKNYAIESDNYGPLFASTTLVCGTENGLTIEGHGEYLQGDAGLAGVDVARPIGTFGTASVAVAASQKTDQKERDSGWLLRAGWHRSTDRFEVNLRARLQSSEFRELGTEVIPDPITSRIVAGVGAKITEGNTLGFAFANQTTAAYQRTNVISMTHTIELGPKASKGKLSIVADHAVRDDSNASVKVSYVRALKD